MSNVRLVAQHYAQALSEALGSAEDLGRVRGELERLAALYRKSPELNRVLKNPVVSTESKGRVVEAIAERLGAGADTLRFLAVVARNDRLALLPEIASAVARAHEERTGVRKAELVSAAPLDGELSRRLVEALGRAAGGALRVEQHVDPELLGGVVARIGTTVLDGSVKTKLERLRARMLSATEMG